MYLSSQHASTVIGGDTCPGELPPLIAPARRIRAVRLRRAPPVLATRARPGRCAPATGADRAVLASSAAAPPARASPPIPRGLCVPTGTTYIHRKDLCHDRTDAV